VVKVIKPLLQIAQAAQQVRDAKLRVDFLCSFADDPQTFIHKWIGSQARDLDVMLGAERPGAAREADLRRSEFFKLPWVRFSA
jgi:SWI/SNF-related matrix-associated actin-dependent regulator of chromatin subfamily D